MYKRPVQKVEARKENERSAIAIAILRKVTRTGRSGRRPQSELRGRSINIGNDLARYLRGGREHNSVGSGSSTPSDISCRTPSPVPKLREVNEVIWS